MVLIRGTRFILCTVLKKLTVWRLTGVCSSVRTSFLTNLQWMTFTQLFTSLSKQTSRISGVIRSLQEVSKQNCVTEPDCQLSAQSRSKSCGAVCGAVVVSSSVVWSKRSSMLGKTPETTYSVPSTWWYDIKNVLSKYRYVQRMGARP